MKIYTDKEAISACKGWYPLLDNDFLSEIYRDETALHEFLDKFRNSNCILDPFTEFEFLRDVFDPKTLFLKRSFIEKPIFTPLPNRQEIYLKIQENAALLSRIYAQKGHNKNTKISLVDLFLGARCMLNATTTMIITGNKKDFPNSIFDVIAVINIEQNDGNMKPYSVLQFNKDKFDKCYTDMKKMESQFDINKMIQENKNNNGTSDEEVPF